MIAFSLQILFSGEWLALPVMWSVIGLLLWGWMVLLRRAGSRGARYLLAGFALLELAVLAVATPHAWFWRSFGWSLGLFLAGWSAGALLALNVSLPEGAFPVRGRWLRYLLGGLAALAVLQASPLGEAIWFFLQAYGVVQRGYDWRFVGGVPPLWANAGFIGLLLELPLLVCGVALLNQILWLLFRQAVWPVVGRAVIASVDYADRLCQREPLWLPPLKQD